MRAPRTIIKQGAILFALVAFSLALLEGVSYALLYRDLLRVSPEKKLTFDQVISSRITPIDGSTLNFQEHHYLNYTLNPDMPYLGIAQYNREFKIRRTAKIEKRNGGQERLLVLGGSTTFGEKIAREQDTWVWQLERLLRLSGHPSVEVINGGVGGYTVMENFIHYVTLLSHLDPTTVVLHVGINDVQPRLIGDTKWDYSNFRRPWRSEGTILPKPSAQLRHFATYQWYYFRAYVRPLIERGIGNFTAYPIPAPYTWSEGLERNGTEVFQEALTNLVHLVQSQHHRVIIIPQLYWVRSDPDRVFAEAVKQHNRVAESVAKELHITFLKQISLDAGFGAEDFFDSCHLTTEGSLKFAELVSQEIKSLPLGDLYP